MRVSEIADTCNVSIRTVYRYINSLLESHVPLSFDKQIKGYRLLSPPGFKLDNIDLEESMLICLGLLFLSSKTDKSYKESIESLAQKICMKNKFNLKKFNTLINYKNNTNNNSDNYSNLITTLLIQTAIDLDKKLYIELMDMSSKLKSLKIPKPAIHFKGEWKLLCKNPNTEKVIPIRKIRRARIIT
jgi:predicted DNA-binding transcriptional regulator YafY